MRPSAKNKVAIVVIVFFSFLVLKSCAPDHATWYGEGMRGKRMANGKPFNPDAFTAASWDYPLGTVLNVSHGEKSVVVVVTDRGGRPGFLQFGKTIDLSRAAFAQLANPKAGSIRVKIQVPQVSR